MSRATVRGVGVASGGVAGAGAFLPGAHPLSALAVGIALAVSGVLMVEYYRLVPSSDEWTVSRWSGAFVGTTMLATVLGVNYTLEIAAATTVSLQLLALALAWNGLVFGLVMAHEERHAANDGACP